MYGIAGGHFDIRMISEDGQNVASRQGPKSVVEHSFGDAVRYDILLVPGGHGTRQEVDNKSMLSWLKIQAKHTEYVTSVCTGVHCWRRLVFSMEFVQRQIR